MNRLIFILFLLSFSLRSFLLNASVLYNREMYRGQDALTHIGADNNDVVVELHLLKNWDTVSTPSWKIIENDESIYEISGSNLIISDNTNLVIGEDTVLVRVTDHIYYDTDTVFVTCIGSNMYFIDPSQESNGDGSEDTPWNTVEYLDSATAIEKYYYFIMRGTSDTVTDHLNPDSTITIGAYGTGDRPLIYAENVRPFYLYDIDGITIRDLHLKGSDLNNVGIIYDHISNNNIFDNLILEGVVNETDSTYNCFRALYCDSITLKNSFLTETRSDAVNISGSENVTIYSISIDKEIGSGGHGDGMQITGDDTRNENYSITHCYINKSDYSDKHGIEVGQDPYDLINVKVNYNRIMGYYTNFKGISFQPADYVECVGNNIKNCMSGIDVYTDGASGHFDSVYFAQNVIDSIRYWGIICYSNLTFLKVKIYNNTFFDFGIEASGSNSQSAINFNNDSIVSKNNIFDTNGNTTAIFYDVGSNSDEDYNIADPDFGSWSEGSNSIETDDIDFVSDSASNFRLNRTSPAIDQGTDVGLSRDLDLHIIPIGTEDIGAYEQFGGKSLLFGTRKKIIRINNKKYELNP